MVSRVQLRFLRAVVYKFLEGYVAPTHFPGLSCDNSILFKRHHFDKSIDTYSSIDAVKDN